MVERHLLERVPISAICEELKISPNMFYRWPQELFENAHLSFETDRKSKDIEATKDRRSQDRKTSPALKGWALVYVYYVYVYVAAVDLCGRLHLPLPYSPMSDANADREEEPVPSLSTSTAQ